MDYPLIQTVVRDFYQTIIDDILIGFHFKKIENLDQHIERIAQFWHLQLNGEVIDQKELPFNVVHAHQDLGLTPGMIDRWVLVFEQTLQKHLNEADQKKWMDKVEIFKKKILDFIRPS
jgi:hemoglobin